VEQTEIEQLVGEAETRVERLRSLYDQYFMGIERIEPQTARKDVERRIQILRKTQIRNTALRFRFQNVLLRYNTFSAHWMRICRQIEEGTYKHHLRKAKERFDPAVQAREARDARRQAAKLEYGDTEPPPPGSLSFEASDDFDVDVDFEESGEVPDLHAALRAQPVPQVVPPPAPAAPARAAAPPPARAPAPVPGRAPAQNPPRAAAPPQAVATERPPPAAQAALVVRTAPAAAPIPAAKPLPVVTAPPAPGPSRPAVAQPAPSQPAARPAAAAQSGARPAPAPVPAPAPSRPAVAQARPAAVQAAPKPAASASAVSDERVRQIYSKYVETKRALGESTASVTMDSLARSLRDSSEKLRQKHVGKNVDFEVQVKDGKTILKPIVR